MNNFNSSKKTVLQLIRYGIVGVINNIVGYLIFLIITFFGAQPKVAMTILYFSGMFISYFSNKYWTFAYQGNLLATSIRFFITYLLGYLLNLGLLVLFVDYLNYPYQIIQGFAIFIVAAFVFIAFKFFVFMPGVIRKVKSIIN